MSFYITLPSNASMDLFKDNLIGNYTTKLYNKIELEGEWECGLAEIMYPTTWLNIRPQNMKITTKSDAKQYNLQLTMLPSETRNDLANKINLYFNDKKITNVVAHYDNIKNIFVITLHPGHDISEINFDEKLADLLGFTHNKFVQLQASISISSDKEGSDEGVDAFLIYSNIINHQFIGNAFAKVLRIIALDNEQGKKINYITKTYDIPHYVSLDTQVLDIININLRDLTGEQILFETGKVVVKLHFRKKYY